jgi:ribosome recycling factor
MINEALEDLKTGIEKAHVALKRELAKIRTGRASADILDAIRVDYYGTPTPINQMANIAIPEPRMLTIKPWDKSQVAPIEKAIMVSDLGLNPQNDGELIRLPMPALTEERRKKLVKVARKVSEECKVSIRQARHDAKDLLDAIQKDGEASEDDCDRARKKVEEIVQAGTHKTDEIVAKKDQDILEI